MHDPQFIALRVIVPRRRKLTEIDYDLLHSYINPIHLKAARDALDADPIFKIYEELSQKTFNETQMELHTAGPYAPLARYRFLLKEDYMFIPKRKDTSTTAVKQTGSQRDALKLPSQASTNDSDISTEELTAKLKDLNLNNPLPKDPRSGNTPPSSSKQDEQLPNMFSIELSNCLSLCDPRNLSTNTPSRIKFLVLNNKNDTVFEADTNGCNRLDIKSMTRISAIHEAKVTARTFSAWTSKQAVLRQAAGEVFAWIHSHPPED
ncbi:hypothetical protein F5X99DRAFT_410702 [Biscogniauxia marginata]|nr:hypothetical protein F5X99DRAFT_410702 [Biscogniauxia marginata]